MRTYIQESAAAVLNEAAIEFKGPDHESSLPIISCFGSVLVVEKDNCAQVASHLNSMVEQYLGVGDGMFHDCEVTTPTSTNRAEHQAAAHVRIAVQSRPKLGQAVVVL